MEFYREQNHRNLIKYVKKLIGSVNHAQNLLKHMFTNTVVRLIWIGNDESIEI